MSGTLVWRWGAMAEGIKWFWKRLRGKIRPIGGRGGSIVFRGSLCLAKDFAPAGCANWIFMIAYYLIMICYRL
jgi:hypothetical protein